MNNATCNEAKLKRENFFFVCRYFHGFTALFLFSCLNSCFSIIRDETREIISMACEEKLLLLLVKKHSEKPRNLLEIEYSSFLCMILWFILWVHLKRIMLVCYWLYISAFSPLLLNLWFSESPKKYFPWCCIWNDERWMCCKYNKTTKKSFMNEQKFNMKIVLSKWMRISLNFN